MENYSRCILLGWWLAQRAEFFLVPGGFAMVKIARSALCRDLKTIIRIQEKIIKARDHTFKIYERVLKQISSKSLIKLEAMEQQLELAYKDRNTAIRRYNALHQLGEMAEGMGIDLTKKLPENEKVKFFNLGKKNNWDKLLDKKLIRKIESHFKNEMTELGYL
jgi:hypothetical protein